MSDARRSQRCRFENKRPLWQCPKCGHKFVTPNIWHSCSHYPLSYHFKGKDPLVQEIFDAYLKLVEGFEPVTVIPQKTRIAFQGSVRFAGAVTRKHWLDCGLWLKRRAKHFLFYKIEKLNAQNHIHSFRLKRIEDLQDRQLRLLLKEAYAVGQQENSGVAS